MQPSLTVHADRLCAVCARINKDFTYDREATTVDTTPLEAFKLKRGVCQDFAHVMILALRSLGIPAGYVSGFLRTIPPPGKERLEGADAMHAWVRRLVRRDRRLGRARSHQQYSRRNRPYRRRIRPRLCRCRSRYRCTSRVMAASVPCRPWTSCRCARSRQGDIGHHAVVSKAGKAVSRIGDSPSPALSTLLSGRFLRVGSHFSDLRKLAANLSIANGPPQHYDDVGRSKMKSATEKQGVLSRLVKDRRGNFRNDDGIAAAGAAAGRRWVFPST